MNILKTLGYKQRIVIAISLALAVLSHFLPEPQSNHQTSPPTAGIEQTFDATVPLASSSSLPEEHYADATAHTASEQMPDESPDGLSIGHESTLKIQTDQSSSQPSFSVEEELVPAPDLFTIPATHNLFPQQLPPTAPVHQLPLKLEQH